MYKLPNTRYLVITILTFLIVSVVMSLANLARVEKDMLVDSNIHNQQNSSTPLTRRLTLRNKDYIQVLNVEIADDAEERSIGLMNRTKLDQSDGMLFIFPYEANHSFWMKNTYIPLDIIFFDANNQFVYVAANAQPCIQTSAQCPTYSAGRLVQYVLETPAGLLPVEIFDQDLVFSLDENS